MLKPYVYRLAGVFISVLFIYLAVRKANLSESNRIGDHIWWISDVSKFKLHYPGWDLRYDIRDILEQIHAKTVERLREV